MMQSRRWTSATLALLIAGAAALAQTQEPSTPSTSSYRIAGTIVDAISGAPLGKTRVLLAPTEDRTRIRTFITAPDGKFVFEDLSPAKYSLMAERHGFPTQIFDMHENYGTAIVAGEGQDTEHLAFRLKPAASIEGRVLDNFGEPMRKACIRSFYSGTVGGAQSIVPLRPLETDDQGMYQLQNLPAGKYFVAVSAKPWFAEAASSDSSTDSSAQRSVLDVAYPFTFFPGVTDWHAATAISLKFGQRATANFTMQILPAIHVRISTGDRGSATTKLFVHPFDVGEIELGTEQIQSQTAGEGRQQWVEIAGIPPGHYLLQMSFPSGRAIRSEVNWSGDASLSIAQFPDATMEALISGEILFDGKANAPTKPDLVLQNRNSRAIYHTGIAADGTFKGLSVPPGAYEVHVANAADFFVWGISADGALVSGTLLDIKHPGRIRLSVVATRSLGTIKGFATKNGTAAPGCMVVLVPRNLNNRALYRRDQSDSDGSFFLRSVLPGDYVVFAINDWDVEWSKPENTKTYLTDGTIVHVVGNDVQSIEVKVQ